MSNGRNFESFVDAYFEYAKDGYVPDKFHYWSGLSAVSAALERKVWLPWANKFDIFPNMYVLLVAGPGVGKSTAINIARKLVEQVKDPEIRIFPEQSTAAAFVKQMTETRTYERNGKIHFQSPAYLCFSEASNSALQNLYGDYVACLTEFYDCPGNWQKNTIGGGLHKVQNASVSMLAGSTFDYLSKLVTKDNIMGGFASRLFYVAQHDAIKRVAKFEGGQLEASVEGKELDPEVEKMLIEDLNRIHQLQGHFSAEPDFGKMWEDWFNKHDAKMQAEENEVYRSVLARKMTNTMKVTMLLSASESDDLMLKVRHWEKALGFTDEIDETVYETFIKGRSQNLGKQDGIVAYILREVGRGSTKAKINKELTVKGAHPDEIQKTLKALIESGAIVSAPQGKLYLNIDPKSYL